MKQVQLRAGTRTRAVSACVASVARRCLAAALLVAVAACGGGGGGGGGATPGPDFTITGQPADVHVVDGAKASFLISVTGSAALQWQRRTPNGTWTDIPNATAPSYVLDAVHVADSGTQFRVQVTATAHPGNVVTSSTAALVVDAVVVPAAIVEQPASLVVTDGQRASFSVTATGSSLGYQWQRSADGAAWSDLANATSPTLDLPAVALGDDGTQWRVLVSNAVGQVASAVARLTVVPAPVAPRFTTSPVAVTVVAGQSATFTAQAQGTPAPVLAWQSSTDGQTWTTIAGETSGTLTLAATTTTEDGLLVRALATNPSGTVNTAAVRLSVAAAPVAPTIQAQPHDTEVSAGSTANFTVLATGNPAVGYQWQVSMDGGATFTNVNGATSTSYQTPVLATTDDAKRYRVIVSNSAGTTTSAVALLAVVSVPTITRDPAPAAWRPGTTGGFFMVAANGGDLHYQWQVRTSGAWSDFAGATSASFALPAGADARIDGARAVVSNPAGSRTSAAAALVANPWTVVSGGPTIARLHAIAWNDANVVVAAGSGSTIVRSADKGTHWSVANEFPAPSDSARYFALRSIAVNGQAGVAVGDAGSVWRSPDGGAHWVQVSYQSSTTTWNAVAFSGAAATAVGTGGQIARSTDGGATWAPAVSDDNVVSLFGVAFNSSGVGLAVGSGGVILRSVDRGASWMRVRSHTENLVTVAFSGTSTAVAASQEGTILRSTDAGSSWNVVQTLVIAGRAPDQGSLAFDGAGHGLLTLDRDETTDALLWTSGDDGATWTPNASTTKGDAVAFSPDGTVLASAGAGGWLLTSVDRGTTQVDRTAGRHAQVLDVAHGSDTLLIAVGSDSTILRSTDAGRTWAPPASVPATRHNYLSSVRFASPTVAVIATGDNAVWRTTDGGINWTEIVVHPGIESIYQVAFSTPTHGLLRAGFANELYVTDDAGATWQPVNVPSTGINWTLISFRSPLDGVEIGISAARYTHDGGLTWTTGSVPPENSLVCAAWLDANTVFASGQDGALRSTDGARTFIADGPRFADVSGIFRVAFPSATEGLATIVGSKVERTHDGGRTWSSQYWLTADYGSGIDITSAGVAIIAGGNGQIYRNAAY